MQEVANIVKTSGSRDPFEICDFIGVNINFADLGNLKGMYYYVKRNRFAIINNNLDEYMQKLVCAHTEMIHLRVKSNFTTELILVLQQAHQFSLLPMVL